MPSGRSAARMEGNDGVTLGLSCGRRRREGGDGGSLSPSPLHERERRGEGGVVTATDQEEQGLERSYDLNLLLCPNFCNPC